MLNTCICPEEKQQSIITQQSVFKQNRKKNQLIHKQTPFLIKFVDFCGLKNIFIDFFIFARKSSSYRLKTINNRLVFQFSTQKFKQIPGYEQQCAIIDTPNHFIPLVRFKLQQKTKNQKPVFQNFKRNQSSNKNLTIIYSHGNCSNIENSYGFIRLMTSKYNYDFIIYDYTGYANQVAKPRRFNSSKHNLSQRSLTQDLKAVIQWSRIPKEKIVLWGFSLGCFSSVSVAAQLQVAGIILQSPFASIHRLICGQIQYWQNFQNDIFDNISLIEKVKSNLLFIHSIDDDMIPIQHSYQLMRRFESKGKPKYLEIIELLKFTHNNLDHVFYSKNPNKLQQCLYNYLKICEKNDQKDWKLQQSIRNSKNKQQNNEQKINPKKELKLSQQKSKISLQRIEPKSQLSFNKNLNKRRNKNIASLVCTIEQQQKKQDIRKCSVETKITSQPLSSEKHLRLSLPHNQKYIVINPLSRTSRSKRAI